MGNEPSKKVLVSPEPMRRWYIEKGRGRSTGTECEGEMGGRMEGKVT